MSVDYVITYMCFDTISVSAHTMLLLIINGRTKCAF